MATVQTPWGKATVVEEATVPQKAGERRFASVVQLLEVERGGALVRFAYTSGGAARRGPVTLRAADLARLLRAVDRCPGLRAALGRDGGGEREGR